MLNITYNQRPVSSSDIVKDLRFKDKDKDFPRESSKTKAFLGDTNTDYQRGRGLTKERSLSLHMIPTLPTLATANVHES